MNQAAGADHIMPVHHPILGLLGRLVFLLTLVLFCCSWLVLFSAPTSLLWIVAIVIGEWGHFAALLSITLAIVGWRFGRWGRMGAVLALATAAICLSPVVRAAFVSRSLPARCASAFGPAPGSRPQPLNLLDLFRGVRSSRSTVTEHVYAKEGTKRLSLDLYLPENAAAGPALPLVLMVHGGSWNGGSKAQLPAMNRYLAQSRYAVASINYRHAPKHQSPKAVEDVFRAIDFLKASAASLHVDASRVVLIGRSAGGQIALSAAYSAREPAIRGVIGFYAPTDMVLGYEKPSRRWVLDSKKVLGDYLGGTPKENPASYAAASPINFVSAATPPTLLIHGGLDPVVWPSHGELLAARLRQAQRPHLYLHLPWATHGCEANLSGPSGQLSLYALERFLAAVLPPAPDAGKTP